MLHIYSGVGGIIGPPCKAYRWASSYQTIICCDGLVGPYNLLAVTLWYVRPWVHIAQWALSAWTDTCVRAIDSALSGYLCLGSKEDVWGKLKTSRRNQEEDEKRNSKSRWLLFTVAPGRGVVLQFCKVFYKQWRRVGLPASTRHLDGGSG